MFNKDNALAFLIICSQMSYAGAATLVHSSLRDYTGAECGIKSYVKTERRECGIDHYGSRKDPACGPARYKSGPSLQCPGSDPGGRVVKFYSYKTGAKVSLLTQGVSTVQGGEDIALLISNTSQLGEAVRKPTMSSSGLRRRETNFWTCDTVVPAGNGNDQSTVCTAKKYVTSCEREEFGVAEWSSCERKEFGEFFKSCDDPSKVESYNTCQIRKTATEISAYIEATSSNIDLLAQQLATAQGNYIFGSKQAKLASCLIARYETDILYEDIVQDLKNNYSAMFGLEYDASQFDCSNTDEKVEYTYQGKSCKNVSTSEIAAKLAIPTLAVNERYFYELCQQKQTVDSLAEWFKFQIEEVDLLLADLIARSNTGVAEKLSTFKTNLKKVNPDAIKCETCRVTKVEASKTPSIAPSAPTTPNLPPVSSDEKVDVIFDGETQPFSAGQGWDITQSTIENSTESPASGQNHLRATLNNANYWAAAAYVVDNWMAKDFSVYQKIRFKAKANKATKVKVFFVSMDNNLESKHLEFQASTEYQGFEFDLSAAITNEYDLSQVQGIVIAVSQPGKSTYLIDLDDIQMIRGQGNQGDSLESNLIKSLGGHSISFSDNFVQVMAQIKERFLVVSLARRMESVEYRLNLDTLDIFENRTKYMSAPELRQASKNDDLYKALVQEMKSAASYLASSGQGGKDVSAYLSSRL